jgi:hypothetical protein
VTLRACTNRNTTRLLVRRTRMLDHLGSSLKELPPMYKGASLLCAHTPTLDLSSSQSSSSSSHCCFCPRKRSRDHPPLGFPSSPHTPEREREGGKQIGVKRASNALYGCGCQRHPTTTTTTTTTWGAIAAPANRHDSPLLEESLDTLFRGALGCYPSRDDERAPGDRGSDLEKLPARSLHTSTMCSHIVCVVRRLIREEAFGATIFSLGMCVRPCRRP